MTTHVVTNDVLAAYDREELELRQRLMDGTLEPRKVFSGLKKLIKTCSWPKFSTWRTIRHHEQRNAENYRDGIKQAGCCFTVWASDMLDQFKATTIDDEVDLGCASVEQLGLKTISSLKTIRERIVELDYSLCLPEDGPVLREQYLDQPPGESVLLAMESVCVSGRQSAFSVVEHRGRRLLLGDYGSPETPVPSYTLIVFRLYKRPIVIHPVPSSR